MIDRDIAMLYGVETKRLNEQVRRNIERFPSDFMFQLREDEKRELVANCDRFNSLKHSSVMPYAFTEQGVAMLSSILRSHQAVDANIQIMRAFVQMRKFAQNTQLLFSEVVSIKQHQIQADERIDELFSLMDKYNIDEKQGIFFQGQIFDAYAKFESFIQSATKEIILIDGYVDLTVLNAAIIPAILQNL
ncbi:MAG: ORF6N domain-containing protein [Paludibacteraceae bacterium]|nr:ORF6N domain-containing protein [Paludibacteraceae bacterium]